MCYLVYLSTDSEADLTGWSTERIAFVPRADDGWEPAAALLAHRHQWYVSCMGGCSCGLRHAVDPSLGFGEPEDWYPEEPEELENTRILYRAIERLARAGCGVDCLDVWVGADPSGVREMEVRLDEVPEGAFRLLENHLFRFRAG